MEYKNLNKYQINKIKEIQEAFDVDYEEAYKILKTDVFYDEWYYTEGK